MYITGLEFLPCVWVMWTLGGLFLVYVLTITEEHAPSYLLYVSEAGTYVPESIVFSVVFSISAFLGAATAYCMYRFMATQTTAMEKCHFEAQKALLLIGWMSSAGTIMVAVFQWKPHPYLHRGGAVLAFSCGAIYNIYQSVALYKASFSSRGVCHLRMAISIVTAVSLLIYIGFKLPLLFGLLHGLYYQVSDVTAKASEWFSMVVFMVYYLTFFTDFQHLCITGSLRDPVLSMREKLNEESDDP